MKAPSVFGPKPRSKAERQAEADKRREAAQPWRQWYRSRRWQAVRRDQLDREPDCRMCKREGRLVMATVCDHVTPHRGDYERFWSGPFQSLCVTHHNKDKQREEQWPKRS